VETTLDDSFPNATMSLHKFFNPQQAEMN